MPRCDGDAACKGLDLTGCGTIPAGPIDCVGDNACNGARLLCDGGDCPLTCSGQNACASLKLSGSGRCGVPAVCQHYGACSGLDTLSCAGAINPGNGP
eukprot:gene6259-58967_t